MRISTASIFALIALAGAATAFHRYAPVSYNPFKPLAISDPVGGATFFKLVDLQHDTEACFAALDEGGVQYRTIADRSPNRHCGFENALQLENSYIPYSASLKLSCPMAVSLAIWERHVVQPAAAKHLGTKVTQIATMGSYACRRMRGSVSGRFSEHARANAVDVSGFRLEDGQSVTLLKHWDDDGDKGRFLKEVRKGACRIFAVALSPDFNRAHADHFHFDMGDGDHCL